MRYSTKVPVATTAPTDVNAAGNNGSGSNPGIVFNDGAFVRDALLGKRPFLVFKTIINEDNLGEGGGVEG